MSYILSGPKFQAIYNGDALNGGILYFYQPGTTTPKSAYPTIADAAAGTNGYTTLTLDAQGQPELTDMVVLNGSYKLVLKNSALAEIWTVDNVNGQSTIYDASGNEILKFTGVASAVNELTVLNAATGNNPTIQATGEADTGIDFENSESEEMLILDAIASAVNELTIKNAATGTGPILQGTGGDANVELNLQAKGTGTYNLKGTADQAARLRLYEDTDNGTNYSEIRAASSIASNRVVTLPDNDLNFTTVTFSARMNADQTINAAATTKLSFDTENFDIGSYYDSVTNFRWTPLVAGYYLVTVCGTVTNSSAAATRSDVHIYKNGSSVRDVYYLDGSSSSGASSVATVTHLVAMNGTTDYLEAFGQSTTGNTIFQGTSGIGAFEFHGILLRST